MRLGSDPEVFLNDKNGKFISIIGKVGAGKFNPKQMDGLPEGFTEQEDNVALEFGIPPAATAEEFVSYIRTVQQNFLARQPEFTFSKLSCTVFPEDQLNHPMALVFGCEPDFNAWTGKVNKKPNAVNPNLRSAGGHVHVETDLNKREVIKAMDFYLGIPSVLMDKDGTERRKLYGGAGAFRPKPYGAEYRTLSNFWIFDEKLTEWVWNQTSRAIESVRNKIKLNDLREDILRSINAGDKRVASRLIKQYDLTLV